VPKLNLGALAEKESSEEEEREKKLQEIEIDEGN